MSEELKAMSLGGGAGNPSITDKQAKTLEYLRAIDEEAYQTLARNYGVFAVLDFEAHAEWTADDCIMCLQLFIESGVWPGYLFSCGKFWAVYIKSLAEERYHTALEYVCTMGTPADLILYLRAAYKFGQQVIPDQEYDGLEKLYLATFPNLDFLNNLTNDDLLGELTAVVNDAIRMSGVKGSRSTAPRSVPNSGSYAALNAEKSTSIKPVRSVEEAYEYVKAAPKVDTHWSLKVDGINTKALYVEGKGLEVAVSRGRAADGWDYTEAVRRVIEVQELDVSQLVGKVTGEGMVDPRALENFRVKYAGKEYKTPKSTAGAMLRAPQSFDMEDYKYLRLLPFEVEGMPKDKAFAKLKACGFMPPPDIVVPAGGIPLGSLEEFSDWLTTNILDPLWNAGQELNIGSDGVVLQLLTEIETDRADKYSDLNIALKFSHWTEAEYTSVVTDIIFEQRRVEMSVVLVIEPVTTRDLNVATRVSVGSSSILVTDGVKVGDKIRFARKSEANNVYLGKV